MFKALILFGKPLDEISFRRHFEGEHRAIVHQLPQLKAANFNWVAGAIDGDAPFLLIVELVFDSEEALQEGLNSEVGQKMARDFNSFASGGVTILFCVPAYDGKN